MKLHLPITLFVFSTLLLSSNSDSQDEFPTLEGPYLGQKTPGTTPEVFAPGTISTPGWEYGVVFAPSMDKLYYIREVNTDTVPKQEFVIFEQKDNKWNQRVLSKRVGTPSLSVDGKTMYFGRTYKERTADGWSEMLRLGPAFENFRIMRVTASDSGTIAFDEATKEGAGILRYSRLIGGELENPKPFPKEINTGQWNAHPFIAPDESYVIWDGQRGSKVRNADLFISFKQADGSWGEAIKMNDEINTSEDEFAAFVTPDGKFLFFNRNMGPDNTDTFWVDAQIIENLRPKS